MNQMMPCDYVPEVDVGRSKDAALVWADTEPYADILSPPEAAPLAESKATPQPGSEATEAEETEWGLA
jgi:hypothetical protein